MKFRDLFKPREEHPLLNKEILQKRFHIKTRYLLIPLALLVLFILNREYSLFVVLTLLSAAFSFWHDKVNRSPVDFKIPLILAIYITRYYGLPFTFVFFIVSDTIPSLIAGGQIEGASIIFIGWFFAVNTFVLLFPGIDINLLGIILVIVEALGSVIIKTIFGYPTVVAAATTILSVVVRIIYFLTLGEVLQVVFETVL